MGLLSKIKFSILLLLFVFIQKVNAQSFSNPDTNKYVRFGIVPFQFPTRSVGVYFGVNKPNSHWEYRPTYTIPLYNRGVYGAKQDFLHYQGINNHIILKFTENQNVHTRLLLIQRTWWYNNQYLTVDNIPSSKNLVLRSHQSALINGGGIGWDSYWDFSKNRFNGNFFLSISASYLYGKRKILDKFDPNFGIKNSYVRQMVLINVSFGLELGCRTKLNK